MDTGEIQIEGGDEAAHQFGHQRSTIRCVEPIQCPPEAIIIEPVRVVIGIADGTKIDGIDPGR